MKELDWAGALLKVESDVGLNIEELASGLELPVPPKLKPPLGLFSLLPFEGVELPKLNPDEEPVDAGSAAFPNWKPVFVLFEPNSEDPLLAELVVEAELPPALNENAGFLLSEFPKIEP